MARKYDFRGYDADEYARLKKIAKDAGLSSRANIGNLDSARGTVRDQDGNRLYDDSGRPVRGYGVYNTITGEYEEEYTDKKSAYFKPKTGDDYDIEQDFDELTASSARPAALTIIPTTSTNVARPYTIAAGWQRYPRQTEAYENSLGTLTCLFRDGTLYNYYDVPNSVWIKFSGSISKGQFLSRGAPSPDLTKGYKHGPADMSGVSSQTRNMIYSTSRRAQLAGVNKRAYNYTLGQTEKDVTRTATAAKGTAVTKSARLKAGKNQATAGRPKKG